MNKFDHITSIHKRLSGQITVAEQQQLDQWLKADPANEAIAQEVTLIWQAADAYRKAAVTDTEGALAKFKKARSIVEPVVLATPPTKVKSLTIRRYFLRAAVAAGFFFGLFFLFSEMGQNGTSGFAQLDTAQDQQETLALTDGSTIYVNEASKFEYPAQFAKDSRTVKLKGEAFFEVAKDAARPFVIATDQLDVKVLGTSFNVFAYPNKETEEVVVATGKVAVTVKQKNKEYILEPGDHLTYNRQTQEVRISRDDLQNAQAWRTGVLNFDSTPLKEVCQTLEKHFEISISIKNKKLLDCPVTVPAFKNPTAAIVLETLETAFSMKLQQKGSKHFELSGGACE